MESARKQIKRKNEKLLKTVVGYLKSDCYMFAPLVSASPPPPAAGFEFGSEFEESTAELNKGKKRRMLETVVEYLKSDYHLYGSIISPPTLGPPLKGGQATLVKRVTTEVCKNVTISQRRTLRSSDVKRNEQYPKTSSCHRPRTAKHDETLSLRRSLRQRYHSSSSTEEAKRKSNKRRIGI
ncbi:PREDICTED: uncharacterized protein LOC104817813 isoform X2 [Tarenaya hassleriana]|uniref:uncharacterized protein LOC104817813 isoform X2 n=1 Tax=Tarenaya hassleriana TaxID=28532 RepID=UPI00053C206A|nr:PREDICTED: uncharacterized protein LOC104817813 isoform X2 [Tarenaya hassleriana]